MKKALFPGSFDPITNGHMDIIKRSARLFDEVIVGIAQNTGKNGLLTLDERTRLASEVIADYPNVTIAVIDGLTVEFAKAHHVDVLIRGLRNAQDFNYEQPIAAMNQQIGHVETLFMPASPEHAMVASSLIKEISHAGGDISPFVPENVVTCLLEKNKE